MNGKTGLPVNNEVKGMDVCAGRAPKRIETQKREGRKEGKIFRELMRDSLVLAVADTGDMPGEP